MEKQKLLVLDLDNTVWKGVILENPNIELMWDIKFIIKTLVDRGIMVSIASKNNFDIAKMKLQSLEIWDYIVFPQINYDSKSNNLLKIISNSHLRPESVTFIDDEPRNLAEVSHVIPDINTETPDFLANILDNIYFQGKPDLQNKRLKQFRILESKIQAQSVSINNDDFLCKSNIRLCIKNKNFDWDRIEELGNRAKQMNYTRKSVCRRELDELHLKQQLDIGEIYVKDNYGDYGLSGFYALNKKDNNLEHFFFSCRIMGMGIENWIYKYLNFPNLVSELDINKLQEPVKYIAKENIIEYFSNNTPNNSVNSDRDLVVLKGSCLMDAMYPLIKQQINNVHLESNIDFSHTKHFHSQTVRNSILESQENLANIKQDIPWLCDYHFKSIMQNKQVDTLILDLLLDFDYYLYQDTLTGFIIEASTKINLNTYDKDKTKLRYIEDLNCSDDIFERFNQRFKCIGKTSPEHTIENLKLIQEKLNCTIITINRPAYSQWRKPLDMLAAENPNIVPIFLEDILNPGSISIDGEHLHRLAAVILAKHISLLITGKDIKLSLIEKIYNSIPDKILILLTKTKRYIFNLLKIKSKQTTYWAKVHNLRDKL